MNTAAKKEILEKAASTLGSQTGLKIHRYERAVEKNLGDFRLELSKPKEEKVRSYWAKVEKTLNNASIAETAFEIGRSKEAMILISEYISRPQAEKLRGLDVPYFDTAGNVYFNEPDLYILVAGQKKRIVRQKIPSLFRPPGMKLLFAFLTRRGLETESYRHISAQTGVPTPTVGVFMGDLDRANFLVKLAHGERLIVRRDELFRRFVENYGESFRQTLNPTRFRSTKYDGRWWEGVDISQFDACWGGETGGTELTSHLRPKIATIYADSLLPKFQAKYRLVRDPSGDIEIVRRFWKSEDMNNVAPPLIVYADLIATADRRNLETARLIYDRYLTDLIETTS